MTEEQNLIQWVYSSKNEQELGERYDQWASSYEKDLIGDFGWYGPPSSVTAAAKYVPKDSRILDAGAGTGLVGQLLNEHGYHNLVAMDLSEGMLDQA
ncbi:MAG TPA: class I SAM-dependent methyltransferase, partial [Dehalococcoidia bacterium]|nr:class I SAM-dependent methyltransferase [Dehalococcoidia bacterium]